MKIAIINITGGGMSGGYKKYLQNIIPRMASNPGVKAMLCASPKSINVQDWFEPIPHVEFVDCQPFQFLNYSIDLELKQRLEKFSPDVIFVPVERRFHFKKVPVVNMIRNMFPLSHSCRGYPIIEKLKFGARKIETKIAVKKASRIIAISKFVKDFLINHLKVSNDKIEMVYYGIDSQDSKDIQRPSFITRNWEGNFLFTAGSIEPYRGLEDLIYAIKCLFENSKLKGLVIAGDARPTMMRYWKRLKDWVQKNNLSSKICWTGNLTKGEMAWCYQNCKAFVMTSRVESFGQIALEAMTHGCVCISADNPCLPEIFKDAAIYYTPKDSKALAEAIQLVLGWDFQQREKMSERAKCRASEFSWDVCAKKTVAVLAEAVENKKVKRCNHWMS